MEMIYSIRSKFFLAFLISALTVVGTCSLSIFFSVQLLSTMNVFIDTTLPRINRGNLLKITAYKIGTSVPALTTSTDPDKMNAAYGDIEYELDRLESLTAEISRNGSRADILGLNWTSQAIRTHAQLLFQLTSQHLILRNSLLDPDQNRSEAFNFPTVSESEKYTGDMPTKTVSDRDTLFEMQKQEVLLRQSINKFREELDVLVLKLSEIASDHMQYIFEFFESSAEQVVKIEKKALHMNILLIVGAVLVLFGLFWRVAVRGFGDRLTIISRAMGREPADNTDTEVPVGGRDEIGAMARSLEGFLKKALRLRELATMDELTRVYNRRSFFELAEKEVERAKRSHMPTAVIMMLDLDNFKQINDTFGHGIGDAVLYETAQTCMRAVRVIDLFARIGGEEFALLMPNSDLEAGLAVAHRIRTSIEAQTITASNGNRIPVTISIGLTAADLSKATVNDALKDADAALYQAKQAGKNQVVMRESNPPDHGEQSRNKATATPHES